MIKLYSTFIEDLSEADYISQYNLLSNYQREKIDSKASMDDKRRSLAVLLLLRRAVLENYGISDFELDYTENGKPILPFCHTSLSHSGSMAVCVVSDKPVGVDVERLRTPKRNRFFTAIEALAAVTSEEYTKIWTKKEAALKKNGGTIKELKTIDTFSSQYKFSVQTSGEYIITVCE